MFMLQHPINQTFTIVFNRNPVIAQELVTREMRDKLINDSYSLPTCPQPIDGLSHLLTKK